MAGTMASTPSTSQAVTEESSPIDRVEKLLRKYKSRQASSSCKNKERETDNLSKELECWNVLNKELHAHGYKSVQFTCKPFTSDHEGYLLLCQSSSASLRDSIHSLIGEVKRQRAMVQDLLRTSTPHTPTTTSLKPSKTPVESTDDRGTPGHSSLGSDLHSQVIKLKYENAKLKADIQNRPELQEISRCQKIMKELETEIEQTKSLLSMEQTDLLQSQQHVRNMCSLLQVSTSQEMLPRLTNIMESREQLEMRLSRVVGILQHPKRSSLSGDMSRHDIWCEVTWDHVIQTLQDWRSHITGLEELQSVFSDVCHNLEPSSLERPALVGRKKTRDKENALSCMEMTKLLRNWLLEKGHLKHATTRSLLAMIKHFQELFSVADLSGVYAAMSRLYQHIEETRNILRHLKLSLQLDANCSNHQLISMVEYLSSEDNAELLSAIYRDYGPINTDEVLEKLRLCEEFFPAFQTVITQLQEILGVDSLSGIVQNVHQLKTKPNL